MIEQAPPVSRLGARVCSAAVLRGASDVGRAARSGWDRLAGRAVSRVGAIVLFLCAFGMYWLQALAWPFQRGRDTWDYFAFYLSMFHEHTPFQLLMLFRVPIAPLVLGVPMQIGGAALLQVVLALLFAGTVVTWAATAARFAPSAAVLTGAALVLWPGFGLMFHEPASDCVSAATFALLAFVATRACLAPCVSRFGVVGLVIPLAVLTRVPNEGFLAAAVLLPLAASGTWRSRLAWGGAVAVTAVVPLTLYALYNSERYGAFTVSRNGAAEIPFHANFGNIRVGNGPSSRELAGVVQRNILVRPPWQGLHVSPDTYFRAGSGYETVRLFGIVDHLYGLGSDYGLLHAAAEEVPTASGDVRIRGISMRRAAHSLWKLVDVHASHEDRTKPSRWPVPPATIRKAGATVPNPEALPPPVPGVEYGFLSCASPQISRCILPDPEVAYASPAVRARYRAITGTVSDWDSQLGTSNGNAWLSRQFVRVNAHVPPPWVWLVVGGIALALRRPRGGLILIVLCALGGAVLVIHALAEGSETFFAIPVVPAAYMAVFAALTGRRAVRPDDRP
jgi:hypothetical protein